MALAGGSEELTTIYLPSNTPCSYFNNTTAHFITDLAEPIELRAGAKVALSELIWPNTVLNVFTPINELEFTKVEAQEVGVRVIFRRRTWKKSIPEKYYQSAKGLIDTINGLLRRQRMETKLSLDETTGKCKVSVFPEEKITMHKTLSNILGFFDTTEFFAKKEDLYNKVFTSEVVPDASLLTYCFFIYSDIVYPTRVGSTEVPVLGILRCDTEKTASQYKHNALPILNFVPVTGSTLNKIEIKITDTTGQLIHFQFGKVIIKLILSQPAKDETQI